KGILENLLMGLHLPAFTYQSSTLSGFHPTRQALLVHQHKTVGVVGELHPNLTAQLNLKEKVYFAEFSFAEVLKPGAPFKTLEPLAIYPGSERDWTLTFKEEASYQTILEILRSINSRLVKKITLLNLYRSEALGPHKKNLSFRFFYRDDHKTLSLEAVDKEHARIVAYAEEKLKTFLA
ncbi:MAG: hypothetical protein FJZ63_00535, partial [Chlamydiae bacterium]|nr:hypothetical protein [Chlamydiota bacterium]